MGLVEDIKQRRFRNEYHKAVVNIIYTSNWLNSIHTRFLKQYGISPEQFNLLRILRGQHPKPATVNLLIDRMLDKMSNASRLVEKLRVKGLVERRPSLEDRRAVDVVITQKGLDLLASIDTMIDNVVDIGKKITEAEALELNRILDKMRG